MPSSGVALDAPDARELAAFYRRLLQWDVVDDGPEWGRCCGEPVRPLAAVGYEGAVGTDSQQHPGEPRLPAASAVVAAIALYALLPGKLIVGPRFAVPGLELLLFIPLLAANRGG